MPQETYLTLMSIKRTSHRLLATPSTCVALSPQPLPSAHRRWRSARKRRRQIEIDEDRPQSPEVGNYEVMRQHSPTRRSRLVKGAERWIRLVWWHVTVGQRGALTGNTACVQRYTLVSCSYPNDRHVAHTYGRNKTSTMLNIYVGLNDIQSDSSLS